jgi:basic membrane protein A
LGIITGDYDNAAKGREAASTLVGNGADVIWHAADVTGLGAIQGAVAGKAKVLGCYSDQTSLAPRNMATNFEMNLEGMVQAFAHATANHTFVGGTERKPAVDWMWLLRAGPCVRRRGLTNDGDREGRDRECEEGHLGLIRH